MTDADAILEMYKIQIHRSEHYENQRVAVTNVVITLAAALVALATFDNDLSQADSFNGALIVLLGVFGLVATKLHGARAKRHGQRASEYRNALDQRLPNAGINKTRDLVPNQNTYLRRVWEMLHLAIILIGVFLFVLARRP